MRSLRWMLLTPFMVFGGVVGLTQTKEVKVQTPEQVLSGSLKQARVQSPNVGQVLFEGAKYVGSERCTECHAAVETRIFAHSKHHQMKREMNDFVNKCKFDEKIVTYTVKLAGAPGDVQYQVRPFKKGSDYFFTVLHPREASQNRTFKIKYATGGTWDQAFEAEITDPVVTENGKYEMTFPAPLRCQVSTGDWIKGGQTPQHWVRWDNGVVPRSMAELPKLEFAQGQCWGCHTTGNDFKLIGGYWRATGEAGVADLGVTCEHCHGPASKHIEEVERLKADGVQQMRGMTTIVLGTTDLNPDQAQQNCARCHSRPHNEKNPGLGFPLQVYPGDTDAFLKVRLVSYLSGIESDKKYFFPNGAARMGNTQHQDMMHGKHLKAGVTCVTCHSPHESGVANQMRRPVREVCTGCHSTPESGNQVEFYSGSDMQRAGVTCADCHFGKTGARTQNPANGEHVYQVSSHFHRIVTPAEEAAGQGRSQCSGCHIETDRTKVPQEHLKRAPLLYDIKALSKLFDARVQLVKGRIATIEARIATMPATTSSERRSKEQAQALLDAVKKDGSFGIHNFMLTRQKFWEAEKLIDAADRRRAVPQITPPSKPKAKVVPIQGQNNPSSPPGPAPQPWQSFLPVPSSNWTHSWDQHRRDAP